MPEITVSPVALEIVRLAVEAGQIAECEEWLDAMENQEDVTHENLST